MIWLPKLGGTRQRLWEAKAVKAEEKKKEKETKKVHRMKGLFARWFSKSSKQNGINISY